MRHACARDAEWRGEASVGLPDWSSTDRDHLAEELSDVLLYLVRLADVCAVDLPSAAVRKMKRNGEKYPADRCAGSAEKYTAYLPPVAASSATHPSAGVLVPLREAIDEGPGSEGGDDGGPPAGRTTLTATVIAPELSAAALAAAGQSGPPVLATLAKKRTADVDDGGPSNKKPRGRPPKGRNGKTKRWVADAGWQSDHSID